jgi:hypothetical protein
VFRDKHERRIEPPALGADPLPSPTQVTFVPPYGGRLSARDLVWN